MDSIVPRELGVLEFNRRVLELADDSTIPVLERLKFICIISNNLDEFFQVLVARLKTENSAKKKIESNKITLTPINKGKYPLKDIPNR